MHLRGLDMNLLVALHVLLRERSITKAGEELHLSQSGMSTALRRLRDFFDDQLLVPIGRSIVLTPLAESLVEPVQSIILQVKTLIDYTPGFDPRTAERQFTVMASDYAATVFLAALLRYLKDAAPGSRLISSPWRTCCMGRSNAARWTFSFSLSSSCPRPSRGKTVRRRICLYCLGRKLKVHRPDLIR